MDDVDPRQRPPPPESVRILTRLLDRDPPRPAGFDIAVLSVPPENEGGDATADADAPPPYPGRAFAKEGANLGVNAPDLPRLSRDFREEYHSLRYDLFYRRGVGVDGGGDGNGRPPAPAALRRMLDATRCLLLICPDHSPAWADRRRVFLRLRGDASGGGGRGGGGETGSGRCDGGGGGCDLSDREWLEGELELLNLLFTQHSKAPSSWAHRKWIGQRLINVILKQKPNGETRTATLSPPPSSSTSTTKHRRLHRWARSEIEMCASVAERFPKNYHAWTHRRHVCRTLFGIWSSRRKRRREREWEWDQRVINGAYLGFGGAPSDGHSNVPVVDAARSNDDPDAETDDGNDADESTALLFELLSDEASAVAEWMKRHVTDHSAVHYGGEIARMLLGVSVHASADDVGGDEGPNDADASDGANRDDDSGAVARPTPPRGWTWARSFANSAIESARASGHAERETTWIRRRICAALLLHVLEEEIGGDGWSVVCRTSLSPPSRDDGRCSDEAWHRFVDSEIVDLVATYLTHGNESEESTHALAYVVWIVRRLTRRTSASYSAAPSFASRRLLEDRGWDVVRLARDAAEVLGCNRDIPHNVWRIALCDNRMP